MQVQDLIHTTRRLPSGGEVFVLNTGAVIGAEAEAMLQALHSRSVGGLRGHLEKLAKSGPEKFMSTFYVGYGHKSIGDCASTTLFIEGVSMLAAKAVQDFMLYNGQEASTRYIDFAKQAFLDPIGTPQSREISENWRDCYLKGMAAVRPALLEWHPRKEGEDEAVYQKAINTRLFDIMRGFLPAGATTNLAWHGELRHVSDHLDRLRHHPLPEVRDVAVSLEDALIDVYPSSFQRKRYPDTEAYLEYWMTNEYYFDQPPSTYPVLETVTGDFSGINDDMLKKHRMLLENRPKQTELPKLIAECGTAKFEYLLDFGSFRDNQRHRAVLQRMPLLTPRYGIGDWYYSNLPESFREQVQEFVFVQTNRIRKQLGDDDALKQYYLPMGSLVTCRKVGDLPALVYLVERRARLDVHYTMRKVAQDIGALLLEKYARYGLHLYMEESGDRFYYKRGEQDITERQTA